MFFSFIDKKMAEYDVLLQKKVQRQETYANVTDLIAKREGLQTDYNAIDNKTRQKLEKILPDTIDNIRLFIDINKMASKYGILVKNINIDESGKESKSSGNKTSIVSQNTPDAYNRLNVSFSFSASYPNFLLFIKDLEESLRVIDIRELKVNAKDATNYNFEITFETYWLK